MISKLNPIEKGTRMKKLLLLAIGFAGLGMAAAKSYSFDLYGPAMLGATTLAPGEYRIEIVDQKAVVRNGRIHCEAPVTVENGDTKYSGTTVRFINADGKMHIQQIRIGGTKTKLVFNE